MALLASGLIYASIKFWYVFKGRKGYANRTKAVAAAADSLSEATQSYSGMTSLEIDAIVPRNEAVCNSPNTHTIYDSPSIKGFWVYIDLPNQACLFMVPALKASGHWTNSSGDSSVSLDDNNCPSGWIWYSLNKVTCCLNRKSELRDKPFATLVLYITQVFLWD